MRCGLERELDVACGLLTPIDCASMNGFDSARLTGREVVWECEGAQIAKCVIDAMEPRFELDGGGGAEARGRRIRSDNSQGIFEDFAPVELIRDTESADQSEGLMTAKVVLIDRQEEVVLVLMCERGEGETECGAERSFGEALPDELGSAHVDRKTRSLVGPCLPDDMVVAPWLAPALTDDAGPARLWLSSYWPARELRPLL